MASFSIAYHGVDLTDAMDRLQRRLAEQGAQLRAARADRPVLCPRCHADVTVVGATVSSLFFTCPKCRHAWRVGQDGAR